MTNRKALIALRDTVVAGQWDHSPNGVVRKVFPYQSASIDDLGLTAVEAFNGSVDAAIALLEAVLPRASFWVETKIDGIHHAGVFVPNLGRTFQAEAPNLGRALLIATLNAMIAESN